MPAYLYCMLAQIPPRRQRQSCYFPCCTHKRTLLHPNTHSDDSTFWDGIAATTRELHQRVAVDVHALQFDHPEQANALVDIAVPVRRREFEWAAHDAARLSVDIERSSEQESDEDRRDEHRRTSRGPSAARRILVGRRFRHRSSRKVSIAARTSSGRSA